MGGAEQRWRLQKACSEMGRREIVVDAYCRELSDLLS